MNRENSGFGKELKKSLVCLLSFLIVASAAYFGPQASQFLAPYALVAAGAILPEGGKKELQRIAIDNLAKVKRD